MVMVTANQPNPRSVPVARPTEMFNAKYADREIQGPRDVLDQERRRRHAATTAPCAVSRAEPFLPSYWPIIADKGNQTPHHPHHRE